MLLLLQGLSFANINAQPIGVLHSASKLTESGAYLQGSSVLKGYISVEEKSNLKDEPLHLISVESFDPHLILNGDSLIFKITPEVGEIFKIPASS